MLHVKTAIAESSRGDIEKRLTGKYYTPHCVSDRIARFSKNDNVTRTVCDPFCGDGRLVVSWLLRERPLNDLEMLECIYLFDCDAIAVKKAKQAVQDALNRISKHKVCIKTAVVDTFLLPLSERYDLVITNPPWEQLKPDSRDGLENSSDYRAEIRKYSVEIANAFPSAATSKKRTIGGYNINLARAGALAATKMTQKGGQILVVLPSTIFGDQVSTEFRACFLNDVEIDIMESYPAEAKLFRGVDQSFVTISAVKGKKSEQFQIKRYKADGSAHDQRKYHVVTPSNAIPLAVGGKEHDLIKCIQERHPSLIWLETDPRYKLKLGRELDETRIAESFTQNSDGYPFLKGRNVHRYSAQYANLPKICPDKKKIPQSVYDRRLVWRDVSRPSQKRRLHACIIEPGAVCGNSLGVARFKSDEPNLLEALLAVMNSLVFEVQVRSMLATNHVSQGVLRRCSIPSRIFEDSSFRQGLVEKMDKIEETGFSAKLEVSIAIAYGIEREQFAELLAPFSKLEEYEIAEMMAEELWT